MKLTETGNLNVTQGIAPDYLESVFDGVGKMYISQEDLSDLNQRLRQLALAAQRHPPKTRGRQLALERLIREIQRSEQFYRPPSRGLSPDVYREIYSEALQELWLSICRGGIDNYQPQNGEVIAFINKHFYWRFKDAKTSINQVSVDIDPETVMPTTETPTLMEQLRDLIEEDPDGIFREKYITNHPEANFRDLALRWLAGETWEHMAAELGIPSVTMRQFYRRSLGQFTSYLREGLEE